MIDTMNRHLFQPAQPDRISKVTVAHDLNSFMPISGEGQVSGNSRDAVRDELSTVASNDVEHRKSVQGLPHPHLDVRSKQ